MGNLFALFITDLIALFAIYTIINFSLRLQLGYTGIANFGLVLAFTGGAYTVGWLPVRIGMSLFHLDPMLRSDMIWNNPIIVSQINLSLQNSPGNAIWVFLVTLLSAALVGALLGLLSGYPAARLRGDYLAISLLALGEVLAIIGKNFDPLVGGALGVQVPDVFAWSGNARFIVVTFVLLLFVFLVWIYMYFIERSPMSRTLRAVRDNHIVAAALGKDVKRIRLGVLVVGGFLCGIAGALYAFYTGGVVASAYGITEWTFLPWVMVVFGGSGSNLGVLLGGLTFVTIRKLITAYKYSFAFLPFDPVWLQYLLMGVVLLFILAFRPSGLVPEKSSYSIRKSQLKQIAKSVLNKEKSGSSS